MNFNKNFLTVLFLSLLILSFRLVPQSNNFTPVLALFMLCGFFAGTRGMLLLIPVIAYAITDLWHGLHPSLAFVYLPLLILPFMGRFLSGRWVNTLFLGFSGASLFFLVSNFGVWWTGTLYSPHWEGLLESYRMALPFFRASLAGTLITLFGFQWGKAWLLQARSHQAPVEHI